MTDQQDVHNGQDEVGDAAPSSSPTKNKDASLKKWLIVAIAVLVILAFVTDMIVGVSKGEGINTDLLQKAVETLFKLISTSDGA